LHVVYIDEVKYEQGVQPFHWLCGLAFPEGSIQRAEGALSDLARSYFGNPILDTVNEFHARDLFHGRGPYKGKPLSGRVDLYKALIDIMADTPGLGRIEVRIDPSKMITSEFKQKAFMFFVEKVEELMKQERSLALLIADHDKEIVGVNVSTLSAYKLFGTDYQFGREILHVVDTIHHTHSHHSRLLQLADVHAYTAAMLTGDCSKYPRSDIAAYYRAKPHFGLPTKYKHWPSDDSWYASA